MSIKAAQNEAQKLRDIIEVSRLVVSSLDLDDVLQKILLYARELVDTPAGSIALFDEASATMTLHAATGLSEGFTRHEQLGILASFAALSIANARLHEKTLLLACTDGLTGLFNHRQFKQILAREVSRAQRFASELSLVMIDIDNFKSFNDRYGHPCGDKILIGVAELLQEVFRQADIVFRYGGEEFVVILPLSGPAEALSAAERAREAVAAMRIACHEVAQPLGVTISVGLASLPQDAQNGEALLGVADQLMYQAKNRGKNRVYTLESLKQP